VSTAVVAVHYQNDIVHADGKVLAGLGRDEERRQALIGNARRLLNAARTAGTPVVSVRIAFRSGYVGVVRNSPLFDAVVRRRLLLEGTWGVEFHERLKPRRGELVVTHSRINAFYGSDLEPALRSLGVNTLIVAGVATHSAVEHTARHAADLGYDVIVAADACASADPELHASRLRALELHVRKVATVDEILESLDG
jgi:biuret amidohydrolase